MRAGRVILAGTLDTKGEEILFLKTRLNEVGVKTLVVDVGIVGKPHFDADVRREVIAKAGGSSIQKLAAAADRGIAVATMQRGLAQWVKQHSDDPFAGMLGIGGSAGTGIMTAGMRELPIGTPKIMVSTVASGDVNPYVGTSDILMMYSVADFSGLNRLTCTVLANAADAMIGMCLHATSIKSDSRQTLLGATMFGVTTPCVSRVKELLEKRSYELLIFHATGTGCQSMERLISEGFIKGVVDLTTTDLADELVGGVWKASPSRLEVAGRVGIPQIVSVGALDMVNFGPPETVPSKFAGRRFYQHNPAVTLMRTTPEENRHLGATIAAKLNQAAGPVTVMLPLRGVSAIGVEGEPFYDPVADECLFSAIRHGLDNKVKLVELDLSINHPEFAAQVVAEYVAIAGESKSGANQEDSQTTDLI
jgi:uncharacterized protein (UPF0261 family)